MRNSSLIDVITGKRSNSIKQREINNKIYTVTALCEITSSKSTIKTIYIKTSNKHSWSAFIVEQMLYLIYLIYMKYLNRYLPTRKTIS